MTKERLTAFTDAVLAIIMTILVLELKKPNPVTAAGFWALRENFFAYTLSFFWLGTMWVNLHNGWYKIEKVDVRSIWMTLIMLFFSSLFPNATAIVAENFNNTAAQLFYGIIVICITISNFASYDAIWKANPSNSQVANMTKQRKKWLRKDLGIKIVGFILSATLYPPAMMYSVLITMLFIVIPNQIKNLHNK